MTTPVNRDPIGATFLIDDAPLMSSRYTRLIFVLISLGLVGCSTAPALPETLVVATAVFPESLEGGAASFAGLSLAYQTMDPLIRRDNDGTLRSGLAVAWTSTDETTWRFELRRGVRFHDGAPFTAADVVHTVEYVLDPASAHSGRRRIEQIEAVTIVNEHTIDISTDGPFPTLILGLSDIPIEAKHYHEQTSKQDRARRPMGTGPFVFARWVPGDRYEVTANPHYWGGAPAIERVVFRQIPESSTRLASLLAHETHIIEELPVDLIPRVEATPGLEVAPVGSAVALVLTLDTRSPPFNDRIVRAALDHAIDKPLILEALLGGNGALLDGQLLTVDTPGHNPEIDPRPYDPARARALLASAGYSEGLTTSITTRAGKYVSDVYIANAVSGMLGRVGITARINVVEGGVFAKMVLAKDLGPIHMVGWYSLGDPDFATVWFTEASERALWHNKEYEELFLKARSTVDGIARRRIYRRMMEIMHEDIPAIFLFALPSIYAKSSRVVGWRPPADKVLRLHKVSLRSS